MNKPTKTTRFLAATLAIGGIAGVANIAWLLYLNFGVIYFGPAGVGVREFLLFSFAGLFVWAGVTGVLAWRTPNGRKWAVIVFASQIPVFNLPALKFWWLTGAQLLPYLALGSRSDFGTIATPQFYWHIGAAFSVRLFGTAADQYYIGLNLFAVLAVILLLPAKSELPQFRAEDVF